jgi:hypothetical protein
MFRNAETKVINSRQIYVDNFNLDLFDCRYAACLEAGMKPELVLSEEKKEQRFWKKIGRQPQTTFIFVVYHVLIFFLCV